MYIVLGATGHIGSVVAAKLLENKEAVTVIIHSAEKAGHWREKGAQVAIVDVLNTKQLHREFQKGKRLYLLNPPANPATDTVDEELKTMESILKALKGTPIEKVVGESTYGAQSGKGIGDLGVLYEMEQGLKALLIPNSIIRGAYYMSNWDTALQTATKDGVIHTLYPTDFKMPMIDPADLGKVAARLITESLEHTGIHYVEGPELYSTDDVAEAFAIALNKKVKAVEIPRNKWQESLEAAGFSKSAAASMVMMTNITLKGGYEKPVSPEKGTTTLQQYINKLVARV